MCALPWGSVQSPPGTGMPLISAYMSTGVPSLQTDAEPGSMDAAEITSITTLRIEVPTGTPLSVPVKVMTW